MLLTDYMVSNWGVWKRKFVCRFMPTKENVKKSNKELRRFVKEIYSDMNYLKDQCEKLAQDQYAKAHLDSVLQLRDSMESVIMTWEETINALTKRIEKLEKKKG